MATHRGNDTGQGRRRQQQKQVTRHNRAEHHAQPVNGQEDEDSQCETHDEDAEGIVRGSLMQPIVAQPFYDIPPSNAPVYHTVLPQYEPYVLFFENRGVLAGSEYTRLTESSTLCNLYGNQGIQAKDHSAALASHTKGPVTTHHSSWLALSKITATCSRTGG
ncbi:hypothetical protein MRX96_003333 [Rhipicephalus microplus]